LRRWLARLDAAAGRMNPWLVLAAVLLGLADFAIGAGRLPPAPPGVGLLPELRACGPTPGPVPALEELADHD
jgi:hypothetical protein